jgi:glycosyltransferase involved in cell wall biosynthesis
MKLMKLKILFAILFIYELLISPVIILITLLSRCVTKKYDIGVGPDPLINNVYHKASLIGVGYKTFTFVDRVYYITDKFDLLFFKKGRFYKYLYQIFFISYFYVLFNSKCIYIYFNGGPLRSNPFFWRFEPFLYKIAGVKVVVMPYGSDVQLLDRTSNLLLKDAYFNDYPNHRLKYCKQSKRLVMWTKYANHVISGCDWVDYMYHWDTLMVSHFSIDLNMYSTFGVQEPIKNDIFTIVHAPNHRTIKGTEYIIKAVENLQKKGHEIELILIEKMSNDNVLKAIRNADLVVDQLIIGWYAMFAIEAMVAHKPTVCFLRQDLLNFYRAKNLIELNDPPLINLNTENFEEGLEVFINDRDLLASYAKRSFEYVSRVHSIESIGEKFKQINNSLGIKIRHEIN